MRVLICLALASLALVQGTQAQQQNLTTLLEPLKGVRDGAAIVGQQLVDNFVNGTHNVLGKAEKKASSFFPPKQTTSSTQPAATTTPVILTSTPPSTPGPASTAPQAPTPLPSTIPATTIAAAASTPPPTTAAASSTAPESSAVPPTTLAASSTTPEESSTVPPTTTSAASSTTAIVATSSVPPSTTLAVSTLITPPSTTQAATTQPPTTQPPTTVPGPVPLHGYRVLAAGGQSTRGILKTAELYSDLTGKWTATGMMTTNHRLFSIVRLLDGRALLAGGITTNAIVLPGGAAFATTNPGTTITELFNATSGAWAATGKMTTPRTLFQMVVLQNGNVLAAGGCLDPTDYTSCNAQATAEVFRPGAGNWTATGNMSTSRVYFQLVALRNGKALVAGGFAQVYSSATRYRIVPLSSAEVYDPVAGNWTSTGSMSTTRLGFKMVLLPDGRVLAAGGTPDNYNVPSGFPKTLNSSEIYDPATGVWTPTRSYMMSGRIDLQMVSLLNGNVLVAGGYDYSAVDYVYTAEVYDYRLGTWNATGSPYAPPGKTSRFDFLMVALPDGNALAAGGYNTDANYNQQFLTTSEVYNTSIGNWSLTGSSTTSRVDFGMVVL